MNEKPVVVVPVKSGGMALFLALLFGPLGMLYATIPGAIVMFLVNLVVGFLTAGFGLILTWPLCALWAGLAAGGRNRRLLSGGRA